MAKPKQNNEEAVSLFPFLSILACLIGVLTFIITGVAISQMDQSEDLAAVERTEKYGPLVAQLEADKQDLQRLDANYAAEQALQAQIEQAELQIEKARALVTQQQQREKVIERAAVLRKQITQVNNQVKTLTPQLSELREEIKTDRAELAKRIEAGKPTGTVVRPSGSGVNLKPNFVECTKAHIVIYVAGKKTTIPRGQLTEHKQYLALLDRVAKQEKERVVFLLRPGSTSTYNTAASIARVRQCRYGKIPVPGDGPLDLSMFD